MTVASSYIIAARRSALGRIGGLHRNRRIADLSAPVVLAALADAGLAPAEVDELIVGNASEGGNPARLISLAAGLPETVAAHSIDRQCASGLDAIIAAARLVQAGEAEVVVAGGAESLSTAPWRVAKPKSLYQLPHFLRVEPASPDLADEPAPCEASELLPRRLGISRARQDVVAMQSYVRAEAARASRRFVGEIVPLRGNAEEARDQSAVEPALDDLEEMVPFAPPDGTLTPGNTSSLHDGAAFVVVVSEAVWQARGKPPALRLVSTAALGVPPGNDGEAPIAAMRKLYDRLNGFRREDIGVFEISESSAAQEIALAEELGVDPGKINPHGGAIARGHPLGAAGAVLVVRLFSSLVRGKEAPPGRYGVATLGAIGGLGLAALFEAVR
ncbi:thiolase family protein [Hyphomicrobium sp.]|uniref:thiolase family protein n=1 Tax=Hyphomicrobium sp. TaxID=82 RepID=UPI0025BFB4EC|nr:thiolase family protein [Hyphomicrobium sp.]MCC7250612.1 thiolase family protein [Hyphomicrobium sp.]